MATLKQSKAKEVVFSNGKGGTGKSTLSYYAALGLAHLGFRVGYIDTDWQKTLTKALTLRTDESRIAPYRDNPADFDYIIVDTPPRLDERPFLRELARADLVVMVTMPSIQDLWGVMESLNELRRLQPNQNYALVVNANMAGRTLAKQFPEMLKDAQIDIPMLQSNGRPFDVRFRECYKHGILGGWSYLDDAGQLESTLLARALIDRIDGVGLPAIAPAEPSVVESPAAAVTETPAVAQT